MMKSALAPFNGRILTLALSVLMASIAIGTLAEASEVPICQSAFETFKITPFPQGYGISAEDQRKAMLYPQTRQLLIALQDTIVVFQATTSIASGKLAVKFAFEVTEEERHAFDGSASGSEREFPENFYRAYLAGPHANESIVREMFAAWTKAHAQVPKHNHISDEALAILAFATRYRLEPGSQGGSDAGFEEAFHKNLKFFVARLKAKSSLPQLGAFIESSDTLFVNYIATLRDLILNAKARMSGDPSILANTMSDQQFRESLTSGLQRLPNLSLIEKIGLALQLLKPEERRILSKFLEVPILPNRDKSNVDKWNDVGVKFLDLAFRKFVSQLQREASQSGSTSIRLTQEAAAKFIDQFASGAEPKSKQILMEAFSIGFTTSKGVDERDPRQMATRAAKEFGIIAQKIKDFVKEQERVELEAQQETLRQQIANQGISAPVVSHKSSQSSTAGQVAKQTRAAHRAEMERARTQAAAAAQAARESARAQESAKESALPKLIELELRSIVAGQRYAFSFNNAAANEDIGSRDEHYVVFSKRFINSFKRRKDQDFKNWVKVFLMGRAPDNNSNGIKLLEGTKEINFVWEVKYIGPGLRAVVQQEKESRIWRWLDFVPHNQVKRVIRNAGL